MAESRANCGRGASTVENNYLFFSELKEVSKQSPDKLLAFLLEKHEDILSLLKENNIEEDVVCFALIALGKACVSDGEQSNSLNELMILTSSDMNFIALNIQRRLLSLQRKEVLEKYHLDALVSLTAFLKTFQTILPSSSFESISILLPLLVSTCNKCLTAHQEIHREVTGRLNDMQEDQKLFFEQHTDPEIKRKSKMEKLHLQEPPENFRSLSILPTADDIDLPCSFLRSNITTGKYQNTEHYLDVQFRLLKEDYIKPLRDGIAEYLSSKRNNRQSLNNSKDVRVYENVFIQSEESVNGDLLRVIKFQEDRFSEIKWENNKHFLTGNLLCLSSDDFHSTMFATVIRRDLEQLKEGFLTIKVEVTDAVLDLNPSIKFVVIETSAMFESYRHNLNVLQLLNSETLPMKRYIVDVEKTVKRPEYLKATTMYDMRCLLLPLDAEFSSLNLISKDVTERCKSVIVTDDSSWPKSAMLNLDESQYTALKSAITKEFAIIQGPPGTGKSFIALRTVQLLLHNINSWFHYELDTMPILIVCHSNHALDQFLEGVSKFTCQIVRIGGGKGRVSTTIEQFRIKKLVKDARMHMPESLSNKIYEEKSKVIDLKKQINTINLNIGISSQYVLSEHILKWCIPPLQFNSLITTGHLQDTDDNGSSIYYWLQLRTHDKTLVEEECDNKDDLNKNNLKPITEVEADTEFMKNQKNGDFYYRDDPHVSKRSSLLHAELIEDSKDAFQNSNNIFQFIADGLNNHIAMARRRAEKIQNVWNLSIQERWQLYKFWLETFIDEKRKESENLQRELKIALKMLSDASMEEELFVIENALVVGMTTTGAAKYRHIIDAMNPVVLIVEEAAEILESHIITSLTPKTQHVVLIGDQQQLRPSPTVHMLGMKYGMNISLFERMILNGMDYCRLSVQHRMRPEIAALIVPHIYPNLENHRLVAEFRNVKGISKNVFFVTHDFDESSVKNSNSKANTHEASFIVKLCRYLILQGYDSSQITVLTTYSGQLSALKELTTGVLEEVRFTTVDNYQGEENDIILISFVRSNIEGAVGFLKVANRINVALSRAKKGLYCIGNFELLGEKSKLWKDILETLAVNKSVGPSLCLTCQNHPDECNEVTTGTDFAAVADGGCNRECEYRLQCGHRCVLSCHPYDRLHELFQCQKPCDKTCKEGHACIKKCFEDCGSCEFLVDNVLPQCGHSVKAPCGKVKVGIYCQNPCSQTCEEGHPCPKKCLEIFGACKTLVGKTFTKCGHTMEVPCWDSNTEKCKSICMKMCERGHPCQKCQVLVDKKLKLCGHTVKAPCGKNENRIKCTLQCNNILPCLHRCENNCCDPCVKNCSQITEVESPVCGHTVNVECFLTKNLFVLSNRCSEPCKRVLPCSHICKETCSNCKKGCVSSKCNETCKNVLPCGHGCANTCSEPCVVRCMEMTKIKSPVCGHFQKIECHLKSCPDKSYKECSEPCREILSCGHTCKGTCNSCNQGRSHVACEERCERYLICGHKCESNCFQACPPYGKRCEDRCVQRKPLPITHSAAGCSNTNNASSNSKPPVAHRRSIMLSDWFQPNETKTKSASDRKSRRGQAVKENRARNKNKTHASGSVCLQGQDRRRSTLESDQNRNDV